jgi:hypothetical protein
MNNTYPITTLRDIFNLPTREQMETCLAELTEAMIQARIANDAIMAVLEDNGSVGLTRAIDWPETSNWVDDGKGETRLKINIPTFTE